MNDVKFSVLRNMRTYAIEFRERNYPKFNGRYNVYVSVYGQLTGHYIGTIEEPLKMDVDSSEDVNNLIESANDLIRLNYRVSIW